MLLIPLERLAPLEPEQALAQVPPDVRRPLEAALEGRTLGRHEALLLSMEESPEVLQALCSVACAVRDRRPRPVTFSPKVFIPLTKLCRDVCGYCAFRQAPAGVEEAYLSPEAVLAIAKAGQQAGCTEALFTLGERPEQWYREAREWLARRGYRTTHEYLHAMCRLVLEETSLLPHSNPGTLTEKELELLRDVNASMGLMLESTAERLCGPGGPHELAPSKHPRARLKTLERAGRARVPFTTGILVGIGETPAERIDALLAIKELHDRFGHIQEVIVQNFRAKPGTPMAGHPEPETPELLRLVAVARLLLGPDMNLQVPPNLSTRTYPLFLLAGINDWGGISPVTIDHVNPEAPWPHIADLRTATAAYGLELKARLPLYPEYVREKPEFIPDGLRDKVRRLADDEGYAREDPQRAPREAVPGGGQAETVSWEGHQ